MMYVFSDGDFRVLESVKKRLYSDAPLTGDDRRDLANTLDAVLAQAIAASEEELCTGGGGRSVMRAALGPS